MNRSHISVVAALIFSVVATSASAADKDESYYHRNPDEAKAKYTECKQLVGKLASSGNIDEMMAVVNNVECKAAEKAVILN